MVVSSPSKLEGERGSVYAIKRNIHMTSILQQKDSLTSKPQNLKPLN